MNDAASAPLRQIPPGRQFTVAQFSSSPVLPAARQEGAVIDAVPSAFLKRLSSSEFYNRDATIYTIQ